ncbi:hypothetical protein A1395_22340 [Pseudomonas protegens]|uniref:His/Gly/Thr/Pro-type tRNA ligase C-terminal domain-containing protein n=1 Tax=Pseudomonas protegens TaxID=380021 RepID=UPI000C9C3F91|nr:His/Gly/Thr/Pro-type tRNA ligase C-terminal domain-containing protein [Pseudomonas protegens]PNG32244.1 hypothetical protein A1395_22340 [Pseudomonas protegens]
MLYRALFGSLERFTGIMLEHHSGKLPVWFSPIQVIVCSISQQDADYVRYIAAGLRCKGLRVETDTRNEKIGYKIREQTLQRIPFLLVAGTKEQEEGTIATRSRDGEDLGVMELNAATDWLLAKVKAPAPGSAQASSQALGSQ